MVQVIEQAPGLGELLGGGIGSGISTGLQNILKSKLKEQESLHALLNRFYQPLTPYQQTLTKERQEIEKRRTSSDVFKQIRALSEMSTDPKLTNMKPKDFLSIHKNAMSKINEGINAPEAIESAFSSFFGPQAKETKSSKSIKEHIPQLTKETNEERITVISKDGKSGTIPKSQLKDALKMGYRKK